MSDCAKIHANPTSARLLLALCLCVSVAILLPAADLENQTLARILERDFTATELSWLLLDARTGNLIAARWDNPSRPIPAGSLVKPFAALTWYETLAAYPHFVCEGEKAGCWLPRGHGRLGVSAAIAHSCNAWFAALTSRLRADDVAATARRFGISAPPAGSRSIAWTGAGRDWSIAPLDLARAYAELNRRAAQPGVRALLDGMALAAREGTAVNAGRPNRAVLAKTGTAPCTHSTRTPGDGFLLALYPADSARFVLLVRLHGRPGSQAASVAGRMLDVIAGTPPVIARGGP